MDRTGLSAAPVLAALALVLAAWLYLLVAPSAEAVNETDVSSRTSGQNLIIEVDNPHGRTFTWQYAIGAPAANCRDGGQINNMETADDSMISPDNSRLTLPLITGIYCLKITDKIDGSVAWHIYQPPADNRGPGIIIRRSRNSLLVISSLDVDLNTGSWRYGRFDFDPNCKSVTLSGRLPANPSNNLVLREEDNGNWYCFKATDQSGNATFDKYRVTGVDTTSPEVSVSQAGRLLTAATGENEIIDWHYVSSPSELDCDEDTFLNNRSTVAGRQATLTSDRVGYHYCFRGTDQAGNFGFAKYQVSSVDFLAPRISLEKNNLAVIASGDQGIRRWSYLKSTDAIDCGSDTDFSEAVSFDSSEPIRLTEQDHLLYFCFRGVNATNTAGYARIRVDTRVPEIALEIDETSITATAEGNNLRWSYLRTDDELDCNPSDADRFADNSDFDKHLGRTAQLNELDNGKWFCFQAADVAGSNYGYAKQQISGITVKAPGGGVSTRGQTDIIIITAFLMLSGGGFVVYLVIKHKKSAGIKAVETKPAEEQTPPTVKRRKRKRPQKSAAVEEDVIQPLDYLKKNREEKKD